MNPGTFHKLMLLRKIGVVDRQQTPSLSNENFKHLLKHDS